jgi:alpha-D-ribose 1-methylphosphonate 5-triphosphate diphosphatase
LRSPEKAEDLVRLIHAFSKSERCSVRHRIHARFEIGSIRSAQQLERLIDAQILDLFSFMDHTPGQGQFKSIQSFVDYFTGTYQLDENTVLETVERKRKAQANGWKHAARLACKARKAGIPILSHDDDTAEKVHLGIQLGVTGCEFPVSMEAVLAAKESGLKIFMGAPNLLRDLSTNGHIKSSETLVNKTCNGFVSDYYPECMIQTPFIAHRKHKLSIEEALRYATAGPGEYISVETKTGYLTPDSPADVVVIDTDERNWVSVAQTWVKGRCVYRSDSFPE